MPYLIELVLFLLPFAGYLAWRRLNPGVDPPPQILAIGVIAVGLLVAGAIWYGLSVSMRPGTVYIPAELGADGQIRHHRVEPRP